MIFVTYMCREFCIAFTMLETFEAEKACRKIRAADANRSVSQPLNFQIPNCLGKHRPASGAQ